MSKKANAEVNSGLIAAIAEARLEAAAGYTSIFGEHRVKQDFHDSVVRQFASIRPELWASDIYEPSELCGVQFWDALSVDEQRLATLSLRHIASQCNWHLTTCRCCGKVYFATF